MQTGIFFHYQMGERLKDFPRRLSGLLEKESVTFYDAFYPHKPKSFYELEPISTDLIYRVHSRSMVERVRAGGEFEGALYSAAGTVSAARKVAIGEITNAFVFTGYGDHHAGEDFFGGGCFFNGAAIAIQELKEEYKFHRFAVIDTDAHHGDGSWQLFENEREVLYICFCNLGARQQNHNVNIKVQSDIRGSDYLALFQDNLNRLKGFDPDIIFWNWGYDNTAGEYGGMNLSPDIHAKLCDSIKKTSMEVCRGRMVVILCGGSRRDLASLVIPQVIGILAE